MSNIIFIRMNRFDLFVSNENFLNSLEKFLCAVGALEQVAPCLQNYIAGFCPDKCVFVIIQLIFHFSPLSKIIFLPLLILHYRTQVKSTSVTRHVNPAYNRSAWQYFIRHRWRAMSVTFFTRGIVIGHARGDCEMFGRLSWQYS